MPPLPDAVFSESLNQLRLPDLWQREAVAAMLDGQDVVVDAPTGAGKTYIFEIFARQRSAHAGQMVFAVPTRALANDKFLEWKRAGMPVGITTGDITIRPDALIVVATLEAQREHLFSLSPPAFLAIDEYQMLADEARGGNYESMLAAAPPETRLLLLSGSVANPQDVAAWLERLGRPVRLIRHAERPVPLDEIPIGGLPRSAPSSVSGFFARAAYGACASGLAPLLIFAPQRAAAERLAKQIAAALPHDLPLQLPSDLSGKCPSDLRQLISKRVCWHHSGLPYALRAGVIEPLAKAGQFRVIVATMGLAAGINFSVRTVLVVGRSYRDGPYERELRSDELLQMFGRAGRRGLDDSGAALTADSLPRLSDAHPRRLQRVAAWDWSAYLRLMERACERGEHPLRAAIGFSTRHFSTTATGLELEGETKEHDARRPEVQSESGAGEAEGEAGMQRFSSGPRRREMMNADSEWEPAATTPQSVPAARVLVLDANGGVWLSGLRDAGFTQSLLPGTRLCRLVPKGDPERWRYGVEWTAATRDSPDGDWLPTRATARLMRRPRETFDATEWEISLRRKLIRQIPGAALWEEKSLPGQLLLRLDLANISVEAWQDQAGRWLVNPPTREREDGGDQHLLHPETGHPILPPSKSPFRAWRRLALIDETGTPTRRGRIVARFQRGEGLAIAAALADPLYPVEDLVWHLANLRGGHRFAEIASGESARLAAACRASYGSLSYPGILELGLPAGYGEGAGDWLIHCLLEKKPLPRECTAGDFERARTEWISLLRHICGCPDFDWPRWRDLQAHAAHLIERHPQPDMTALAASGSTLLALRVPDLTLRRPT